MEISGITTFATGFPIDVSYAGGSSNSLWCPYYTNYYACPDVPNQLGAIQKTDIRTARSGTRLTTSRRPAPLLPMRIPAPSAISTATRYHGPGRNNTNIDPGQELPPESERNIIFQLRLESDNVFNHTQFNAPSSTWSDNFADH